MNKKNTPDLTLNPEEPRDRGGQPQPPMGFEPGKILNAEAKPNINDPPHVETCDQSKQGSNSLPSNIQDVIDKSIKILTTGGGGDWVDYLRERQNAVYATIPSDACYTGFVQVYGQRLSEAFPQNPVEKTHNYFDTSIAKYTIYFPTTNERKGGYITQVSDNETFTLLDGKNDMAYITFRPFGLNSVELSRMLVLSDYQRKGIGTTLVKLAQILANESNARILLFPAPPLAAEVADRKAASRRLRDWYFKLGFVNSLPEMLQGFRLTTNEPVLFGWCDLMAYR